MNNQQILKDCYVSEIKSICCSEQDIGSPNKRICSLCQKISSFLSKVNGLLIC